jgi:ribosomal-protein-alanine N-acetyltransferase
MPSRLTASCAFGTSVSMASSEWAGHEPHVTSAGAVPAPAVGASATRGPAAIMSTPKPATIRVCLVMPNWYRCARQSTVTNFVQLIVSYRCPVPTLERLRLDHGPALLAFEQENRAYFAASIPDRGDEYFRDFDARHRWLLAEQAAGVCHFHLLVDGDGSIVGRINLVDVANRSADLGYRIAERAAGRGRATTAVHQLLAIAAGDYGLIALQAATTLDNVGSQTVLNRTGFVPIGETTLGGRSAIRFVRRLSLDLTSSGSGSR